MKIIAICGSGRSGSTLLSLLLSQDRSVFNLGQLRHLWRAFERDADDARLWLLRTGIIGSDSAPTGRLRGEP